MRRMLNKSKDDSDIDTSFIAGQNYMINVYIDGKIQRNPEKKVYLDRTNPATVINILKSYFDMKKYKVDVRNPSKDNIIEMYLCTETKGNEKSSISLNRHLKSSFNSDTGVIYKGNGTYEFNGNQYNIGNNQGVAGECLWQILYAILINGFNVEPSEAFSILNEAIRTIGGHHAVNADEIPAVFEVINLILGERGTLGYNVVDIQYVRNHAEGYNIIQPLGGNIVLQLANMAQIEGGTGAHYVLARNSPGTDLQDVNLWNNARLQSKAKIKHTVSAYKSSTKLKKRSQSVNKERNLPPTQQTLDLFGEYDNFITQPRGSDWCLFTCLLNVLIEKGVPSIDALKMLYKASGGTNGFSLSADYKAGFIKKLFSMYGSRPWNLNKIKQCLKKGYFVILIFKGSSQSHACLARLLDEKVVIFDSAIRARQPVQELTSTDMRYRNYQLSDCIVLVDIIS